MASPQEFYHSSAILEWFWFSMALVMFLCYALRILVLKEDITAEPEAEATKPATATTNQSPDAKYKQAQISQPGESLQNNQPVPIMNLQQPSSSQQLPQQYEQPSQLSAPENVSQEIIVPQQQIHLDLQDVNVNVDNRDEKVVQQPQATMQFQPGVNPVQPNNNTNIYGVTILQPSTQPQAQAQAQTTRQQPSKLNEKQQKMKAFITAYEQYFFLFFPYLCICLLNIVSFGSYIFCVFMTFLWILSVLLFNCLKLAEKFQKPQYQKYTELVHHSITFMLFFNYFINDQTKV